MHVNICPFPVLSVSGSLCFPDPVGINTIVILETVQGRKLVKHWVHEFLTSILLKLLIDTNNSGLVCLGHV